MAFDGLVTYAIAKELSKRLTLGKIEKVYQPGAEELLIHIHTKAGNDHLFISSNSVSARMCITDGSYTNPEQPPTFCMLLRKHIQGGRITNISQKDSERIIEMDIEAQNEMGFSVCRRLVVEIMSKHSNIVLVDLETGRIIDSIKRISIDVNRYRQLLPGIKYEYPPKQDKIPFKELTWATGLPHDEKGIMSRIAGISPAIARQMLASSVDGKDSSLISDQPAACLLEIIKHIEEGSSAPVIYLDNKDNLCEFHVTKLDEFEDHKKMYFDTVSGCVDYYFTNRESSNLVRQKSLPLLRSAQAALDKALLKKKKLSEDLLKAEDSDKYRLYGELLTANIHVAAPGAGSVKVVNYYDGNEIEIPLDERLNAAANAQRYFKKYSKARTAIHEKKSQLEENESDIKYLESVVQNVESADSVPLLDSIRNELEDTGYVKRRAKAADRKKHKDKPEPITYTLSDGSTLFVGRNNKENDFLSMKFASKTDVWFHTKDIPGSHCILKIDGGRSLPDLPAELVYEAASIAAYHSKARESDNVPVDYVPVRYIKKPAGAKPGMVVFTNNQTVYVTPKLPQKKV